MSVWLPFLPRIGIPPTPTTTDNPYLTTTIIDFPIKVDQDQISKQLSVTVSFDQIKVDKDQIDKRLKVVVSHNPLTTIMTRG